MRLLNVNTLEFREFLPHNVPTYAIASHRWIDDAEVTLKDVKELNKKKAGWKKLEGFTKYVKDYVPEAEWLWIDTCCINKDSDAELSRSINSMFKWYQNAEVCLAYLADVKVKHDLNGLGKSEWFRRGWTLQELLAPRTVVFLTQKWDVIGYKGETGRTKSGRNLRSGPSLNTIITTATGISERALCSFEQKEDFEVSERLRWAKGRETTLEEDLSYCLFGIFNVSLPVIYGEGAERARMRLLKEVREADGGYDTDFVERSAHGNRLLQAAKEGQSERISSLLNENPAIAGYQDSNGLNALHFAAWNGSVDCVALLTSETAYVEEMVSAYSTFHGTPLCLAALRGNIQVVKLLVEKHKARVHGQQARLGSAIHAACIPRQRHGSQAEVVRFLLDNGASPLRGQKFDPYFAWAADRNLEIDSDSVGSYDINVWQPILVAAYAGNTDAVNVLLDKGADVNASVGAGTDWRVGMTSLMCACHDGLDNLGMVMLLLRRGADLSLLDARGKNALHHAASFRGTKIITALLNSNQSAYINNRNIYGQTPLILAAQKGDMGSVDLLIKSGALLEPIDNDGKTAMQYAKQQPHTSCVEALQRVLARTNADASRSATAKASWWFPFGKRNDPTG